MIELPDDDRLYRWRGSGFVQVRLLEKKEALHLWVPQWGQTRAERSIHDHSFWFTSTVLLGTMTFTEFTVELDPAGDMEFWHSEASKIGRCNLIKVADRVVNEGETYSFGGPGRFHDVYFANVRTIAKGPLMTHVTREKKVPFRNHFVMPLGIVPDHTRAAGLGPSPADMHAEVVRVLALVTP